MHTALREPGDVDLVSPPQDVTPGPAESLATPSRLSSAAPCFGEGVARRVAKWCWSNLTCEMSSEAPRLVWSQPLVHSLATLVPHTGHTTNTCCTRHSSHEQR